MLSKETAQTLPCGLVAPRRVSTAIMAGKGITALTQLVLSSSGHVAWVAQSHLHLVPWRQETFDKIFFWNLKKTRICHPKICLFDMEIILSSRQVNNIFRISFQTLPPFLPKDRM